MDKADMALRGRIGGYARASRYGATELTGPARHAFFSKFLRQVDPEGVLPELDRNRRARSALRAYMARLARLSVEARRGRKRASQGK